MKTVMHKFSLELKHLLVMRSVLFFLGKLAPNVTFSQLWRKPRTPLYIFVLPEVRDEHLLPQVTEQKRYARSQNDHWEILLHLAEITSCKFLHHVANPSVHHPILKADYAGLIDSCLYSLKMVLQYCTSSSFPHSGIIYSAYPWPPVRQKLHLLPQTNLLFLMGLSYQIVRPKLLLCKAISQTAHPKKLKNPTNMDISNALWH